jgi:hypothetical protein
MHAFVRHPHPLIGSLLAAVLATVDAKAAAEDWEWGGHVKYQATETRYQSDDLLAQYGDNPAGTQQLDTRLRAEKRAGAWDFAVHYEILGVYGDTLETRRTLAAAGLPLRGGATGLPDDDARLFDLTDEFIDRSRTAAVQRLDRLSVGYGTSKGLVRVGRQVVSWGNGLVFQPLDFVNPFSPIAIDKDYKTGDDMLFAQRLLAGQGDVQAIAVVRRDAVTHSIVSSDGSYAAKWRQRFGGLDVDLLAARHFQDNMLGIGLVHNLGGAVGRLDLAVLDINESDTAYSLVANLDYSWTWLGLNLYGYAEYFRNGLGAAHEAGYLVPDPALTARLARGELFTLARDYAALGLQVELHPLVNAFANLLQNLNDASRYLQLRAVYDWREDVQFMGGFNLPSGTNGSEYGGIPVATTGTCLAPGRSVYLRAAYYF